MHPIFGVPYYAGDIVLSVKDELETGQKLYHCDGKPVSKKDTELYTVLSPPTVPPEYSIVAKNTHNSVPSQLMMTGDGTTLYIITGNVILVSFNNGDTWGLTSKSDTWNIVDGCASRNGRVVYAATEGKDILKSTDKETFVYSTFGINQIPIEIVCDESGSNAICITERPAEFSGYTSYYTSDSGDTWRTSSAIFDTVAIAGTQNVVLGSHDDLLYKTGYDMKSVVQVHTLAQSNYKFTKLILSRSGNVGLALYDTPLESGILMATDYTLSTWIEVASEKLPAGIDSTTITDMWVDDDNYIYFSDGTNLYITEDRFDSYRTVQFPGEVLPDTFVVSNDSMVLFGHTITDDQTIEPTFHGAFDDGKPDVYLPDFRSLPEGDYLKVVVSDPL